ncbi:HD domain-containing phosphohydrolase [Mesoterricola sediminis]|uniref:Response regulator n=1 Tax=Mesoterricola sediminis TaxID=2927980 RepID=A0AA48GX62_9BACT|nr:HD domain-containing phosphohydrolase [Mesoterricola sediminis]BDU77909.1 response regulator [Mesoterricola sediminis]
MPSRVLFVDDDPLILTALARAFRKRFDLTTATSGREALDLIRTAPPFAVLVADMRMPGMDGVELLQEVKVLSPDTTRIMLTGQGDQLTAIEAVNSGSVFRFLTKPCDLGALGDMVEAGAHQYDLVTSGRELLEQTLSASIQMLVDLLSSFDPHAFGQAEQVRDLALRVATILGIPSPWDLGLAALLSPVGRMALPRTLQAREAAGEPLTAEERLLLADVPDESARLVGAIPRLAPVARIIRGSKRDLLGDAAREAPLEARILHAVADYVEEVRQRRNPAAVLGKLRLAEGAYDPHVLAALERVVEGRGPAEEGGRQALPVWGLQPGMCLVEDLVTLEGALVLSAGTRLSPVHLERLRSVAAVSRLPEPVLVTG